MDVRRVVIALGLFALASSNVAAAPFVPGLPQSLSQQIAAARAAVVARPVDATGPKAGWVVEKILRDATGSVVAGKIIHPEPTPSNVTPRVLLISNADRTVTIVPLSDAATTYLAKLPAVDAPIEERLQFVAGHLGASDRVIAEDAYAELSRLSREELEERRDRLPVDRLRGLLDDPETPADRLGLYGFLLGLCGTPDDAARLRRRLLNCDEFHTGADGLAAGYLLLAGEPGLVELEARVLQAERSSPMQVAALLETLAFFRSEMAAHFDQDRLRKCACCALARIEFADLAVGHLAAARDWKAMPQVVALLQSDDPNPTRRRAVQVAAVRFLLECQRDVDAASGTRAMANQLLDRVADSDPDLLRRATRISGGPPPRY